jgi:hypothetical protein
MSDYFQNQLKFFGMTPSFAFVRQPETNGVAERFIRTLKEQIVFGRIYQNIEEVCTAVRPTSSVTISTGCWKRTATKARARSGGTGWPQRAPRRKPHNAAFCPINRGRYILHCYGPS